jgi:hypothetical protein
VYTLKKFPGGYTSGILMKKEGKGRWEGQVTGKNEERKGEREEDDGTRRMRRNS